MKLETERDGIEWMNVARALAVVSSWSSLGLFDRLRDGPVSRADLPGDRRALDATIPVLVHVGLLASDGDRVGLSPTCARLLAANALPTVQTLELLNDLSKMDRVLSEGGPVRDDKGRKKATRGGTVGDRAQTEKFLDYLYRISEEPANGTFTWLAPGLPTGGSVLDLGGGHGRYARVFADAGYAVTLFDQPDVIAYAKKRHGNALSYLEGDFHTVDSFGGPYDLMLLCNIVHGEGRAQNSSLVERAARDLRPGGRLAIRDMLLDEDGAHPGSAAFFAIAMLFYTKHGYSPTVAEARDWCTRAGLVDPVLTVCETYQIVSARRPG